MLVVACSSTHTDNIKSQLGVHFHEPTYLEQGGEEASKKRMNIFCEMITDKKAVKEQLQLAVMKEFSGHKLRLVNAEIILADKQCK